MARLLWEHQGQVIKDYPFVKGSVTIGRRKESTVAFTNPEVSSSHARIDKVGTDYILTDLQSTNGTFVNGKKVLSHRLSHGDRISIGKNVLLFIGTEKAKVEAERAKIPLDQTVIIGGGTERKRAPSPELKKEKQDLEPVYRPSYWRIVGFGFLVVGALVALGIFLAKDKSFRLKGIPPSTNQEEKTDGTPRAPSPSLTSESRKPSVPEQELDGGDTERPSLNIEAIVWSSDARKSFVVVNGAEFREGDSIEGKFIVRIERDHVVLQSPEGESIVRLTFK